MGRLFDSGRREKGLQDRLHRDAVRFLDGHAESSLGEVTSSDDRTAAPVFAPPRARQNLLFAIEEALATGD